MAGFKFLNPLVKIILCTLGMAVMGYFVYDAFLSGELYETTNIVRALVFLGFSYLLIQSLKDLSARD
jgi:hypothetical protein